MSDSAQTPEKGFTISDFPQTKEVVALEIFKAIISSKYFKRAAETGDPYSKGGLKEEFLGIYKQCLNAVKDTAGNRTE